MSEEQEVKQGDVVAAAKVEGSDNVEQANLESGLGEGSGTDENSELGPGAGGAGADTGAEIVAKDGTVEEKPLIDPVIVEAAPAAEVFGSAEEKLILAKLSDYQIVMQAGKQVPDATLNNNQVVLYRVVQSLINGDSAQFEAIFPKVLAFIAKDEKGAFHERRIYRGMDNLSLPEKDRLAFPRIFHLIKLIAVPSTRGIALKQVDVKRSLEYGVTGQGFQNIANFLNL